MKFIVAALLALACPSVHANSEKCEFLLTYNGAREVNSEWMRLGTPLRLSGQEADQLEQLHGLLNSVFSGPVGQSAVSLSGPYFSRQLQALEAFAVNLQNRMKTWQARLTKEPLPDGLKILRIESEIDRMETLLNHGASEKVQKELQAAIDKLVARFTGRRSTIKATEDFARAWLSEQKQSLAKHRVQLELQRQTNLAFIQSALPILTVLKQAINKAEPNYKHVALYAYTLAGVEEYFSKLLNPDPELKDRGNVKTELEANYGVSPEALLDGAKDLAEAVLRGNSLDPEHVGYAPEMLEKLDDVFGTYLIVPFIGRLTAKTELALGFLPLRFWRLPEQPSANRMTDQMSSPGAIFVDDLTLSHDIHPFESENLDLMASGKIPALTQSFAIWETLLRAAAAAGKPGKTFALLHLARFHDAPFFGDESQKIDWSDPSKVMTYLFEQVALYEQDGRFAINQSAAQAVQDLRSYYEAEFGINDDWTFEDVVSSLDVLIGAVAKLPGVQTRNLTPTMRAALQESPTFPMRAFLQNLRIEGKLDN